MISPLQKERKCYQPKLPQILKEDISHIAVSLGSATESIADQAQLKEIFAKTYGMPIVNFSKGKGKEPKALKVGVVLSGGPAPGGHNVIAGIFDAIKNMHSQSQMIGFLAGPSGILNDKKISLTKEIIDSYRNTGGFDIIGSGRTKLDSEADYEKALQVCKANNLDCLVVIGGDDSNTNAAILAEYFQKKGSQICVVGVPKTIDGDLKNEYIEASFGFDTACKTYSELIGNIARDAVSSRKYWHFIKLMGRSASHIALECALQTQPNITLISEEIEKDKRSLKSIAEEIAAAVLKRSQKGLNFGIVLIPEGLLEFIPEVKVLISEISHILAHHQDEFSVLLGFEEKISWLRNKLSEEALSAYDSLPSSIKAQLLGDRDPHGNVRVSAIETEVLLISLVKEIVNSQDSSIPFEGISHFLGYEGRCAFPSNFDADYGYALGYNAAVLAHFNLSGYMSSVRYLNKNSSEWILGGIPLTMMMNLEYRHGQHKPVIKKALVELQAKPFKEFILKRDKWSTANDYLFPGSIQYFGPSEVCDITTKTLSLELS